MKTVYLGIPYSHTDAYVRHCRFHAANRAAARLYEMGYNVLSPISHSHPISLYMQNSNDSDFWTSVDDYWQRQCDQLIILTMTGWQESKGLGREIDLAVSIGQQVFFMDPFTHELEGPI